MEICSRFTGMERKNGAFLLHTDNANVKVCFVTDEIVRVRASFDHELAEEPYVLMTTAWEDWIKPLPDAALYRSTRIHHTPDSYTKRELVGAGPLHLAYARPFGRLKAPLGLSLLRYTLQTRSHPKPCSSFVPYGTNGTACRAYITSPRSYRTDRRYNDQNECSTDS